MILRPDFLHGARFVLAGAFWLFGLGWLVPSIVLRAEYFTPLEKIPISFSLSVGSIAVLGMVGHFLGLSLKAVQYVIASLFLLLLLCQGVRWRTIRQAQRKSDKAGWSSGSVTLNKPANLSGKLSSLRQTLVAALSRSLSRPDIVILTFAAFCSFLALRYLDAGKLRFFGLTSLSNPIASPHSWFCFRT